jgi:hypothetical protein
MMEVYIGIAMIVLTILFFVLKSSKTAAGGNKPIASKPKTSVVTNTETLATAKRSSKPEIILEENIDKVVNTKDYIVNSFRKDREIKGSYIYEGGRYFLQYNVMTF